MKAGEKEPAPPKIKSRPLLYQHDIPVGRLIKFWEGLAQGKVHYTKCKKCSESYYPPQADCPKCLGSDMDWLPLSGEGTVVTFTLATLKPQGFTHYTDPYTIAVAETPEGVKVLGWLEGTEPPKVGMAVKITSRVQPDGFPVIAFSAKS